MNILLLDADNLICRAFYAIPLMYAPTHQLKNGIPTLMQEEPVPTNAIRGFSTMLLNLKQQTKADMVIAAFDAGIPEKRKVAAPSYKANRGEKPVELSSQLLYCYEKATNALGAFPIKKTLVEADDILYTLALRAREQNKDNNIFIASGDKDVAQCLSIEKTTLLRPSKSVTDPWEEINKSRAKEIFGVEPEQIADYLAIIGDSCDNLPGVAGAGPKTAQKWLTEHQNITNLLKNKGSLKPERLQARLDEELLKNNLVVTTAYDVQLELPKIEDTPLINKELFSSIGLYRIANSLN